MLFHYIYVSKYESFMNIKDQQRYFSKINWQGLHVVLTQLQRIRLILTLTCLHENRQTTEKEALLGSWYHTKFIHFPEAVSSSRTVFFSCLSTYIEVGFYLCETLSGSAWHFYFFVAQKLVARINKIFVFLYIGTNVMYQMKTGYSALEVKKHDLEFITLLKV